MEVRGVGVPQGVSLHLCGSCVLQAAFQSCTSGIVRFSTEHGARVRVLSWYIYICIDSPYNRTNVMLYAVILVLRTGAILKWVHLQPCRYAWAGQQGDGSWPTRVAPRRHRCFPCGCRAGTERGGGMFRGLGAPAGAGVPHRVSTNHGFSNIVNASRTVTITVAIFFSLSGNCSYTHE